MLNLPVGKFSSRLGERCRLVVCHTTEGARTVRSLAGFLRQAGVQASYHAAFDDTAAAQLVPYDVAAWAVRNGNQESDNGAFCGFVKWPREVWLREHGRMLDLGAAWVAARCAARGVPIRLLSDREVADALVNDNHPGGVCDHWAYTRATRLLGIQDGTHTDVGSNCPMDVVIARAQQIAGRLRGPLMALTDQQQTELLDGVRILVGQITGDLDGPGQDKWGWPSRRHGGGPDLTPVDLMREVDREVNSPFDLPTQPGPDRATLVSHVLSTRTELRTKLARIEALLGELLAAHPKES